jgi:hypothetical protein
MNESNEVKLTRSDNFFNGASALGFPITLLACVQWTVNTWIAQYNHAKRKGKSFRPHFPHKLSVFVTGGRSQMVIEDLRAWGVSAQEWSSQTIVENGVKGMALEFLVSAAQWEFADAILFQNEGDYIVTSASGSKRGATFGQPWGVGAKARSFDEGLNGAIAGLFKRERKTAKLGKTYQ